MKLLAVALSDIGLRRKVNQDSFYIDETEGLFIVADGMGGHRGGEVASKLCVDTLADFNSEHRNLTPRDRLDKGINESCLRIFETAQKDPELEGMGTTAICMLVDGDTAYFGHVGDSRAYLIQKGGIWQITEDHSLLNEELRAGRILNNQADAFQFKNVITRSVGYEKSVAVDIYRRRLQSGDTFVLCSDGLSGPVEMHEIAQQISKHGLQKGAKRLIELANERGGDDNITVVVCQVQL